MSSSPLEMTTKPTQATLINIDKVIQLQPSDMTLNSDLSMHVPSRLQ